MTRDRASTGRCAMRIERRRDHRWWTWSAALLAAVASADPPPPPPATAEAAHLVVQPEGLRGRLLRDGLSPVRGLDPAVFTEISPVTASDPAVRLPADQLLEPLEDPAGP